MDFVFAGIVVALYGISHGIAWAIWRLGDFK
jgi:hypothetical protein